MPTKPVAFMVMPFGEKTVDAAKAGASHKVDFDQLWKLVYRPALEGLGYEAVRADSDTGTFVIKDMLERLVLSDLVLADLSAPNPNVYYEIGVRHALPKGNACVLVALDWARIHFDVDQQRQVKLGIPAGPLDASSAPDLVKALQQGIEQMRGSHSPFEALFPTYPEVAEAHTETFRERAQKEGRFRAELDAARNDGATAADIDKFTEARNLLGERRPDLALELLYLIRDRVGFADVVRYVEQLPAPLQANATIREQQSLALAKTGDLKSSARQLRVLIDEHGATPERLGLLGGRYKQLWKATESTADRGKWLTKAIDAYSRGMWLDLNEYYCACNLSRLYRARNHAGDADRSQMAARITLAACQRAESLGNANEWLYPTLLGAAFDARDEKEAEMLVERIEQGDLGRWKIETTLADLVTDVATSPPGKVREALESLLHRLGALVAPPSASTPPSP